jgi:nicotinate-nucleotide--dimethylbenzimidazole phosphoribosyltransferase
MVRNLAQGGAAINVLSRYLGWNLRLIDSGIASPVVDPKVISAAVARGTQSTLKGPAMTKEQYQVALTTGAKLFREQHSQGCRLLACGEMGIGNSSSAALILHALSGVPLEEVINRGAGCNDQQLAQKLEILCEVRSHLTTQGDPELVLQYFAGFEMVMMIGAILQAAELQTPIVIDGLIVSSTCYAALKVQPQLKDYLIFAHRSAAGGHDRCLQEMGVRPLLDLGLCLGEGTGAALALPLLGAACALLREMATFESAAVPERSPT